MKPITVTCPKGARQPARDECCRPGTVAAEAGRLYIRCPKTKRPTRVPPGRCCRPGTELVPTGLGRGRRARHKR